MGIAANINDIFRNTGRYEADIDNSGGDEVVWLLNIIGAVPEDSGEIGCQSSISGAPKEYTKLDVVGEEVFNCQFMY